MADNIPITPGSGRDVATDNIGGVDYQRIKVTWGTNGVAGDAAAANPLPVQLRSPAGADLSAGLPVTGTFWQATQPVSGTVGISGTVPVSAAALPLPTGAATEATLGGVLTISDFDTKVGSLTETAPATDTASSGLNGRLQRLAQRISSLIGLLPTALGVGGGLKVDGSGTALPVSGTVTANAGTNLSTAALALETGGNLATLAGAVSSSKVATKAASGDFADGALATIGAKADAKSTSTDTTPISAISIWKQISASIQAAAASLAGTLTVATHAVTQSGTWTVQPGNTPNTTAWLTQLPGRTPAAGTASAITTGGTAVTLVTGPCSGGYITNPPNASAQGITTAENAYVDKVGTPGSTDSAANGTTTVLFPGQTFTFGPLASGSVIKGNAATNGHKLTVCVE